MVKPTTLDIHNFAQIQDVHLEFGDLTVLVGAQGTGKSLALQWFKSAFDGKTMITRLREAGQQHNSAAELVDLIFGSGMGSSWHEDSAISLDGRAISPAGLSRRGDGEERVFFIPAHRSTLISDGWAMPFQRFTADHPIVARLFSQNLFDRFSARSSDNLFPVPRLLKKDYRTLIDDAVFHGGTIAIEQDQPSTKRLKLSHGQTKLPFMTWTAGQREFTPLLLGLYHLLPPRKLRKWPKVDWVVVEEPEMGLHPKAISVFVLLVLDLLWRGYKVVLSTHSPDVLTAVWMLQRLKESKARWQLVAEAFGVGNPGSLKSVAESALKKTYRVHSLYFERGRVRSADISQLDPDSSNATEADWGGLTGFSSKYGDAVRKAVNLGSK